MNTTLTNSTLYELDSMILALALPVVSSVQIINFTLSFPLNIYIIILLIRTGGLDRLVIFSLNQAVSEVISALSAPLFVLCYVNVRNFCLVHTIAFSIGFCTCTRILFQCCVCLERYLAVVHPLLFLKYKSSYRSASSLYIWISAVACGILFINYFLNLPYSAFEIVLVIVLTLHIFFCLSILRALRKHPPGERERKDSGGNVSKKKAFQVVSINLLTFLMQTIPLSVALGSKNILSSDALDLAFIISISINVAGVLHPIIILHQTGKLTFVRNM